MFVNAISNSLDNLKISHTKLYSDLEKVAYPHWMRSILPLFNTLRTLVFLDRLVFYTDPIFKDKMLLVPNQLANRVNQVAVVYLTKLDEVARDRKVSIDDREKALAVLERDDVNDLVSYQMKKDQMQLDMIAFSDKYTFKERMEAAKLLPSAYKETAFYNIAMCKKYTFKQRKLAADDAGFQKAAILAAIKFERRSNTGLSRQDLILTTL